MAYKITENCIGCTQCARNCPVGAISGQVKSLHEIDPQLCIDCGLCSKLCPKNAILDKYGFSTEKVPKDQWTKPQINKEICVGCSLCVENCPSNCLEIEGPSFHGDINTTATLIDENACISCKICAKVCPIAAIKF